MPSSDEMKALMREYVACLNAGDLEGIMALYAEDATVEDPVGTGTKQGTAEIRAFYEMAIASGAKLTIVGPQTGSSSDYAAMPVVVDLAQPGLPAMKINVIETMRFNEAGKVIEMRAYWGPEDMGPAG
ncbi:MAG: nuclear transport factor 2 family protein [Sterolibacterium sp.]|nr:nuclear transport factor 2 family protein [Sterolibacterium sp.]